MDSMDSMILTLNSQTMTPDVQRVVFNNNLLARFKTYTDVKDNTMQGYLVCLRHFIKWLYDNGITEPKREDIINYKRHLEKSSLTAGTKQQYFRAVKHLFKWLVNDVIKDSTNYYYKNDITSGLKGFKNNIGVHKKDYFKEQDIINIIDNIDTSNQIGKRDKAIILLMITGGLRVSEVRNIDIEDIEIIDNRVKVYIQRKGHAEKDVCKEIIPPVYESIKEYLNSKGNPTSGALFTGTSNRAFNQRITKERLTSIIKQRLIKAGYDSKRLTTHSLRHSSNTIYYHNCNDLFKVQQHADHRDPKTTEIYIHTEDRDNLHSEQAIYNQIFSPDTNETINNIKSSLDRLNKEQAESVLKYIKGVLSQ